MLRYFSKRILFAFLALIVLLILVFFLMQAVPGYPIMRDQHLTDEQWNEKLNAAGLLANPLSQFFTFIGNFFKTGQFGKIYSGSMAGTSVSAYFLSKVAVSMSVAAPAFILSSVIGISLGIVAAYYRGRWLDTLINVVAALFISVPSFIFALYLIQLAGLIGLPSQYLPNQGPGKEFLSLIMPILSMTLASISVVLYYTRNELVEVFKQDYIKTALSKGVSFKKIVFTHALRNAAIPIIACLLPAFMVVISGSIIIEKLFAIRGAADLLVEAIQTKEIYLVTFATVFYASIYFILVVLVDIIYTIIDPRIILSSKHNISLFKQLKLSMLRKKEYENNNVLLDNQQLTSQKQIILESECDANKNIQVFKTINKDMINQAYTQINKTTQIGVLTHELDNKELSYINESSFQHVNCLKYARNEQIVGKPSTYIKDVFKRFTNNKFAIVAAIIFFAIIFFAIIIPLATPDSTNSPIGSYVGLLDYLPPRLPGIIGSGIVPEKIITLSVFNSLIASAGGNINNIINSGLCSNIIALDNGTYLLQNFNPYVLPGLENVYPIMGTDGLGRNWWDLMWYSTAQSLVLALIAAFGSVALGTIYGAIAGSFAGKAADTVLMRVVDILQGVPLIIWVLILSTAVSGGSLSIFTIALALIVTTWMPSAVLARTYIIKYKDAEFVQAAQTLGASKLRIIFIHLIPNIIGRLAVTFVNKIPSTIFFEVSLVFLGIKGATEVSLGTMIDTAQQTGFTHLLIGPTLTIVLITLTAQLMANNLNDSLDPRISA